MHPIVPLAALAAGAYLLLKGGPGGTPLLGSSRNTQRIGGIDPRTLLPLNYPSGNPAPMAGGGLGATSVFGQVFSTVTSAVAKILAPGNANPAPPKTASGSVSGQNRSVLAIPGILGVPSTQALPSDIIAPPPLPWNADIWFDNPMSLTPTYYGQLTDVRSMPHFGDLSLFPPGYNELLPPPRG